MDWEAVEPVYRKGTFYSPGDKFTAPESAMEELLAKGIVKSIAAKEKNEPAPNKQESSVVKATVEATKEQAVEETKAEKPAPKKQVKKQPTSRKASEKTREET